MIFCNMEDVNRSLAEDAAAFVAENEAAYERKIRRAAEQIRAGAEQHPIVLLSGPSGSGKTTSALKIEALLDSWGCEAHTLSLDNYFCGAKEGSFPLDDEGNTDLESPQRLDSPLLSEHLEKIAACVPVEVPTFDFARQCRTNVTIPLHRHKGELVILEGIHALNPEVSGAAADTSIGVYVSVRARVAGSGVVLHPEKIRLLRRLLRDSLFRGQDYSATISRLRSVSRGESLYIMPHKCRAAINIDTLLPYELAVYRDELLEGIEKLGDDFLKIMGVSDLRAILEQSAALPMTAVPEGSLLREFIGHR